MPKGSKTSLFISSTCYDLSQIRSDLRDFSEAIGLEPLMSEYDTFPVNPSHDTLSNCLEVVRNRADIFALIVGGRYGSITETGKSITNLEFSEACAKGIPKYVFVKDNILALLPFWKDNPDADFKSTVDTPKLFQFISELRDSGDIWVFPFSSAKDITDALRKQISYLLAESLDIRSKFHKNDANLARLQPKALRLAIEKPLGWEWLLFAQVFNDSINSHSSKRLDVELGISFGEPIRLDGVQEVTSWVSSRFGWISNTIQQLSQALNFGFIKAVGEPGEPGDIQRIIHLAIRLGDAYEQLLDWKLQFLRVLSTEDEFTKLIMLASEFSSNAIKEIEEFAPKLYSDINHHLANINNYEKGTVVTIPLTLTVPQNDEFYKELDRLHNIYSNI